MLEKSNATAKDVTIHITAINTVLMALSFFQATIGKSQLHARELYHKERKVDINVHFYFHLGRAGRLLPVTPKVRVGREQRTDILCGRVRLDIVGRAQDLAVAASERAQSMSRTGAIAQTAGCAGLSGTTKNVGNAWRTRGRSYYPPLNEKHTRMEGRLKCKGIR